MKSSKWLLMLIAITLFYPVLSCSLMETDVFQELKEKNSFKSFEDIPFFTNEELLNHLRPYASLEDGVIIEFDKERKPYILNIEETSTNTTNNSLGWGISNISVTADISDYTAKIETMIDRNTLYEYVENGQGNIADTITNLQKIEQEFDDLTSRGDNFGYVDAGTKEAVERKLTGICSDIDDLIAALQEGGM